MKKTLLSLLCCLLIYSESTAAAGNGKTDSLQQLLSHLPEDSVKVNTLNLLCREFYKSGEYDKALVPGLEARTLGEKTGFKKGLANALHNLGLIYKAKGDYTEALTCYSRSLKLRKEIGDKQGISFSLTTIGNIYSAQGDYPKALEYQFLSLKIGEEINDNKGIASSTNNLGNIYKAQADYTKANEFYFKSLKISEQIKDKQGISSALNNIGGVFYAQADYPRSLDYYNRALRLFEETGNKPGTASGLNNIANIYDSQGDFAKSLDFYSQSLQIRKEIGDKRGIAGSYCNIGSTLLKQKKIKEARDYLQRSLSLSQEIHSLEEIKRAEGALSEIYNAQHDPVNAFLHYKAYISARDSLLNEENTKRSVRAEMNFNFEKKQSIEKAEEEKRQFLADAESRKQKIILYAVSATLLLVMAFAAFVVKSYRQKKLANEELDLKNRKLESAYHVIEEKNGEITDSINYALRIQQAILPSPEDVQCLLPECFVLFKPKAIVSGDFYWIERRKSAGKGSDTDKLFVAAADCTGHGVPGAFMSMIGAEKLSDSIAQHASPGEVLSSLNVGIKSSLRQSDADGSTRDGMDIALCSLPVSRAGDSHSPVILHYAGANRPLWVIRKNASAVEEIKATKTAIGGYTPSDQQFENHSLDLYTGDTVYLCSDGYADQFGGDSGKKLTTKRFREILLSIQEKTMEEQKNYLHEWSENWKAGKEQIDDILVIGIRI